MTARVQCGGRRPGFTLVELLVVVSVIVILMSISVPMIGKGIASANRTRCGNNLNQIFHSINLYTEHNPRNPRHYFPPLSADGTWVNAVTNFARDSGMMGIFVCPARAVDRISICYAGHPLLLDDSSSRRYKNSDVARPSGVILVGDRPQGASEASDNAGPNLILDAPFPAAAGSTNPTDGENLMAVGGSDIVGGPVALRHTLNGVAAANFVFVDGHVDTIVTNAFRKKLVALSY
jgi:prepilin-type N-terminal cleavage/methylation domain-containing protein/prepilin-type processing-associated H-X9-DG protein